MNPTAHDPRIRLGRRSGRERWPWWVMLGVLAATVIALRIEDRLWWCECATVRPWISDIWTPHCSQHLLDPYSLTHLSHGLVFGSVLMLLLPRWTAPRVLAVSVALAAGWEVLENSAFIIDRYRSATMSLDYLGDSVVNAVGDILCCVVGTLVALRVGWKWSLALFFAIDALLLWWIRDNLTLGTLMLVWPIDAIKAWQTASAPI